MLGLKFNRVGKIGPSGPPGVYPVCRWGKFQPRDELMGRFQPRDKLHMPCIQDFMKLYNFMMIHMRNLKKRFGVDSTYLYNTAWGVMF